MSTAPELPAVPERIKAFEAAGEAAGSEAGDEAVDVATLKAEDANHDADGASEPEIKLMGGDHSDARLRQSTWQQISFNIFFYMFGASQIPFAMGQMGWYWGSGILVALTLSSWISGHYLTDACERTFT